MIDSETGIEAYVQKYQANDHYKEYKASSESPFYTGNSNECYIEAITGERFQIGVVVPKFNFKGYSHIEVTWDIDGGSVDCSSHFEKPRKRNVVLEPMFDEYIGKVAGETRSIGLSFGEVQRSKYSLPSLEVKTHVSRRGRRSPCGSGGTGAREAWRYRSHHPARHNGRRRRGHAPGRLQAIAERNVEESCCRLRQVAQLLVS